MSHTEEDYEMATYKIEELQEKLIEMTEKYFYVKCELDIKNKLWDKLLAWAHMHDPNHELPDYIKSAFNEHD